VLGPALTDTRHFGPALHAHSVSRPCTSATACNTHGPRPLHLGPGGPCHTHVPQPPALRAPAVHTHVPRPGTSAGALQHSRVPVPTLRAQPCTPTRRGPALRRRPPQHSRAPAPAHSRAPPPHFCPSPSTLTSPGAHPHHSAPYQVRPPPHPEVRCNLSHRWRRANSAMPQAQAPPAEANPGAPSKPQLCCIERTP
jgi:hypothetical protein